VTVTSAPDSRHRGYTGASLPIGVFGGTFDPVHFGHLRAALEVQELAGLQGVRLIPAAIPPHRESPDASAAHRLAMLERAAAGQQGFSVDDRELRRNGPSYTVDTLRSLRDDLGPAPLCLILGMDAFQGLADWYRWELIPELAHLVVACRPGAPVPTQGAAAALLAERRCEHPADLAAMRAGRVLLLGITQLDISASDIRQRIAEGRSARFLAPDPVCLYINRHGLYQSRVRSGTREVP
jgi:nicotinate-nucleotide adenylyltransferase